MKSRRVIAAWKVKIQAGIEAPAIHPAAPASTGDPVVEVCKPTGWSSPPSKQSAVYSGAVGCLAG